LADVCDMHANWQAWPSPSQCEFVQVLARMNELRIFGDWTTGDETVALDSVQFIASSTASTCKHAAKNMVIVVDNHVALSLVLQMFQ